MVSDIAFDIEKVEDEIEQWKMLERWGPKSDLRLKSMLKEVLSIAGNMIKLKETIETVTYTHDLWVEHIDSSVLNSEIV